MKLPVPHKSKQFGAIKETVESLFDASWYIQKYPDIARQGIDPIDHFMSIGWAEGRWPNPLFDTDWYLAHNPDVELSGVNPLVHYCETGWHEGRDPHPLFSTSYYLNNNPDVVSAGTNPLTHYLMMGHREPRDPHPLFESGKYLEAYPDIAAAGVNPLAHYIGTGWREGRRANPIFDPDWYVRQSNLGPDQEPLSHYAAGGTATARISPNAMFNGAWYLEKNPDVAEAGLNPLAHYLQRGGLEQRDPNPEFNTKIYLEQTPEVLQSGLAPLAFFLKNMRDRRAADSSKTETVKPSSEKKTKQAEPLPDLFNLRAAKVHCDRVFVVRIGSLTDAHRLRNLLINCSARSDIIVAYNRDLKKDLVEDAIGASMASFVDYSALTENAQLFLDLVNNGQISRYRSIAYCDARNVRDDTIRSVETWSRASNPDNFVFTPDRRPRVPLSDSSKATARILRARLGRKIKKIENCRVSLELFSVPGFVASEIRALGISASDIHRFGTIEQALALVIEVIAEDSGIRLVQNIEQSPENTGEIPSTAKIIAFYLPQYHPIPENDSWWGKGFTEWKNTAKARPLFRHHHQPQLPADLGFYDLRLPETQIAQAELARKFGVHGFCYYYYWFDGKKILNQPIEQMLESGKPDLPYCICWANENWSRNWDGQNRHVLLKQNYSKDSNRKLIREFIKHFNDGRYIRFDGKPVLIIYRIRIIPNWRETAEMWRAECRAAGIGEIYLCAVRFGLEPLEGHPSEFGLDAYILFPPHETARVDARNQVLDLAKDFNGELLEYDSALNGDLSRFEEGYPWPVHRGAMLGWDNTARRQKDSRIFLGSTPSRFRAWLSGIFRQDQIHSHHHENLVFVNAWNEWAEGTMLEPSEKFGQGYLQAVQSVLGSDQTARSIVRPRRVEPKWLEGNQSQVTGGATTLLCAHVVSNQLFGGERSFIDMLDALSAFPLNIIVAIPSDAHPDYTQEIARRASRVVVVPYRQWRSNRPADPSIVSAFEEVMKDGSVDCVYANTIVLLEPLIAAKQEGLPTIIHARELIDEDPQLLESIGLPADKIIEQVHTNSDIVIANSEKTYRLYERPSKTFKAPNVVCGNSLDLPNSIRSGVPVFGIVSSNLPKKGVPEFIEVARQAFAEKLAARFVIIGPENRFTEKWKKSDLPANCEFLGYRASPREAMKELNVLLSLSTFAESFGRTVAEAQAARRPVIAFKHGAIPELVRHGETGFLAAPGDVGSVMSFVRLFCQDPQLIEDMGEQARGEMLQKFSPGTLRRNLLAPMRQAVKFSRPVLPDLQTRQVSIIVPVFNAATATRNCLASIEKYLNPKSESVIVIDDGSTDPEIVALLTEYEGREGFKTHHNGENIGYTRTINKGISMAGDNDVVLLNSDTIVTEGWLEGLRNAAYSASNVATSTAMSDNAGAFSFPVENQHNKKPDEVTHENHARSILANTRGLPPVEVPTGSGFCMFIRRDALNRIGMFDEHAFPRGYGEENDFCMRAVRCGWTHVIAPSAYVFHVRTASFGAEKATLIKSAIDKVTSRYPEYASLVKEAFTSDKMKALRDATANQSSVRTMVDSEANLEHER